MNQEQYTRMLQEQKQLKAAKDTALFNFMTKEARERYRRVEMAHPQNASKALMFVLQGVQTGRFKQVTEEMLKKILISLNDKKDYSIIRK